MRPTSFLRATVLVVASCAALSAGARLDAQDAAVSVPQGFPGRVAGYLAPAALPNSLALVPPVPQAGSAALVLDEAISRRSLGWQATPRWTLAAADADLGFPHAAGTFSCALNAPVSEADTPRLYQLLRRTLTDLGGATRAAKAHYQRARPFMSNGQPLCTPAQQKALAKDGSYPSGHSAAGWGWALILAELSPAQADAILLRGLSFGDSRMVCNVHWHSDVVQGRQLAAAVVARLHAETAFRADLDAARGELDAARAKGLKPTRDCPAEAAALVAQPDLAQ